MDGRMENKFVCYGNCGVSKRERTFFLLGIDLIESSVE